MGPFEKLDNIKNLINKPLNNKTIRNSTKEEELEDYDNALEYYDRYLAIKPENSEGICNKARILIDELDEFDEGLKTLELITVDSEDVVYGRYQQLTAEALLGLKKFHECEKQCEKILELEKNSINILSIYAQLSYFIG